ncbi:hypothetical protein K502DRAFT_365530 [Neoconidiobolus thromboides FSU 785]|nr:hypothetical protein K502DRAFT_365530 [Neoconidiobolus thromboides FSU 785]
MDDETTTQVYSKPTNMYLSNDNLNGQFAERAKWSDEDIDTLFNWFKDPSNVQLYNFGIKAKAIRALAELLPSKSSRQIYNKMNSLESQYQATKLRLKQGIPITERDLSLGIDTAQTKVKSIFRYYYEMDKIVSLQNPDKDAVRTFPVPLDENSYSGSPAELNFQNENIEPLDQELNPSSSKNAYSTHGTETYEQEAKSEPFARSYEEGVGSSPTTRIVNGEQIVTIKNEGTEHSTFREGPGRRRGRKANHQLNTHFINTEPQHYVTDKPTDTSASERVEKAIKSDVSSGYYESKLAHRKKIHEDYMALAKSQLESEAEARRLTHEEHKEWAAIRKLELEYKRTELILERIKLEKQYNINIPINIPPSESPYIYQNDPINNGRAFENDKVMEHTFPITNFKPYP